MRCAGLVRGLSLRNEPRREACLDPTRSREVIDAMNNWTTSQPAAIFLACSRPMASEEIAGTAVYRTVAPVGVRNHGTTVPVAGFLRVGPLQVQAAPLSVIDRKPATGRGTAPRGRPV
jgi:hypothetical protein